MAQHAKLQGAVRVAEIETRRVEVVLRWIVGIEHGGTIRVLESVWRRLGILPQDAGHALHR